MGDVIRHLVWFFMVSSAVAYVTFLVIGSAIHADASGARGAVVIRDELARGVHHLSGMIMVPSTCDQVTVRGDKVDAFTYHLTFSTWEEPSVACSHEDTPRAFRATIFAPSVGVDFNATLDDIILPIAVYPAVKE
ncbi:hypothetical protein HY968_00315 [Candidatus Kaiserbacteria bacterium]|nr:hypothetical protein [Candidatus Kaiserbacteria bacterium]